MISYQMGQATLGGRKRDNVWVWVGEIRQIERGGQVSVLIGQSWRLY